MVLNETPPYRSAAAPARQDTEQMTRREAPFCRHGPRLQRRGPPGAKMHARDASTSPPRRSLHLPEPEALHQRRASTPSSNNPQQPPMCESLNRPSPRRQGVGRGLAPGTDADPSSQAPTLRLGPRKHHDPSALTHRRAAAPRRQETEHVTSREEPLRGNGPRFQRRGPPGAQMHAHNASISPTGRGLRLPEPET